MIGWKFSDVNGSKITCEAKSRQQPRPDQCQLPELLGSLLTHPAKHPSQTKYKNIDRQRLFDVKHREISGLPRFNL
jgi:hypothetical protein